MYEVREEGRGEEWVGGGCGGWREEGGGGRRERGGGRCTVVAVQCGVNVDGPFDLGSLILRPSCAKIRFALCGTTFDDEEFAAGLRRPVQDVVRCPVEEKSCQLSQPCTEGRRDRRNASVRNQGVASPGGASVVLCVRAIKLILRSWCLLCRDCVSVCKNLEFAKTARSRTQRDTSRLECSVVLG